MYFMLSCVFSPRTETLNLNATGKSCVDRGGLYVESKKFTPEGEGGSGR